MGKMTASDWNAVKWYMSQFGYKIKDMMVYPTVRSRDKSDKVLDVSLFDIKEKYKGRTRAKKASKAA